MLLTAGAVLGSLTRNCNLLSYNFLTASWRTEYLYFLKNNLTVIILLLSGSFSFGCTTFINLLLSGLQIGSDLKCGFLTFGGGAVSLILPHGIFEIPAIIIAGAAGFKIPYEIVRYLAGRKGQPLTKEDIKEYLTLAAISIILIVIAAWIEANITLKMAKAMLNQTEGI